NAGQTYNNRKRKNKSLDSFASPVHTPSLTSSPLPAFVQCCSKGSAKSQHKYSYTASCQPTDIDHKRSIFNNRPVSDLRITHYTSPLIPSLEHCQDFRASILNRPTTNFRLNSIELDSPTKVTARKKKISSSYSNSKYRRQESCRQILRNRSSLSSASNFQNCETSASSTAAQFNCFPCGSGDIGVADACDKYSFFRPLLCLVKRSKLKDTDENDNNDQKRPLFWTGEKVDKFCQFLFPSMFLLFNIIYWYYYMTASYEQRQKLMKDGLISE
uniref:Uncharacterized protein n=1 Tax=Romanomermis culicivorax TaxID=13658 RepID=A0A915HER3_ROMCU